jgi:hypothetical protein
MNIKNARLCEIVAMLLAPLAFGQAVQPPTQPSQVMVFRFTANLPAFPFRTDDWSLSQTKGIYGFLN